MNELLEDYQEFNEDEALDEFIKLLWDSNYGCRTYRKTYAFKLQPELLKDDKLIELFSKYEKVEIRHAKSFYKDNPTSIDMIRIHINNMYMYLTYKDVYLSKEYVNAKLAPKKLYFKTIEHIKNGEIININEIEKKLNEYDREAESFRLRDVEKKINLTFKEYKKVVNGYIFRLFNNYKPPHEYEEENGWELTIIHDAWHEDNYIVKYFCKSLTGYMQHYVRDASPKVYKTINCEACNREIVKSTRRVVFCENCSKERRKIKSREYSKKSYHNSKHL